MKKCIFVVFFVSFLLFASLSYAYPSWLINAFATYGNAGISIVIDGSPPTITVYYPLNDTYNYLNNIYLHYYITDQSPISAAWYSLNSGQNTSLSGNITINAQEGANRIRVYANDSLGFLNSTAVAFFVNLSKPDTIILPGCFLEAGSETTNVSGMTRAQIGSIQNLTLHNAGEGKIRFGEMINLSDDNNGSNSGNVKIINLTAYVNLSFNRIYIDTANLPNLNKSATLYLFSLSFTNPRILMNNETCPPTVCTKLSYSNNLLIFNVTHFSEFKAEETPTETPVPASTPSAGGGGGTSTAAVVYPIKTKDLEVFESLIHFNLKEILPSSDYLTIRNPNMFPLEITLFFNPVLKFLDFQGRREKYSTTLLPNETRKIQISVAPHLDIAPGTYQTLLTIAYNQTIKEVPILIDIYKGEPLFDIALEIPEDYNSVNPGGKIVALLQIYNLGTADKVDITLDSSIKDFNGNIILKRTEVAAIMTSLSKLVVFDLPDDLKAGRYVISIEAKYNSNVAVSSAFFDVKEKRDYEMQLFNRTINFALLMFVSIIVLIVLIIIGLIIIYKTRQRRVIHKRRRISKKTEPSDTKKEKDIEDIVEEISKNQEQKQ